MSGYLQRRLQLRHLRVLQTLAEKASLARAAEALGLTQPALTKCLREVEQLVGGRLFERHPRGVSPTPAGEAILKYARRIAAEMINLEYEIDQAIGGASGIVTVGALATAAVGIMPGVISRLRVARPDIRLVVVQDPPEELMRALGDGEVDFVVGLVNSDIDAGRFTTEVLYRDTVSAIGRVGHPLSACQDVLRLKGHDIVMPIGTMGMEEEQAALMIALGIPPQSQLRTSSLPLARELLLTGDTVAVLPRLMMAGDLLRGTVEEIMPIPGIDARHGGIVTRRNAMLGAEAEAVAEAIRLYAAECEGLLASSGRALAPVIAPAVIAAR